MNIVKVKMADLNIAIAPDRLKTTGLGSCVGIVLYDKKSKIGGMAHIMLPSSKMVSIGEINEAKYADTAIPAMLAEMIKKGADKNYIIAKLAGGSQMFQFKTANDLMRIGPRNVESSREILNELKIKIVSEDTGGSIGRTIEFDALTGILHIKTANQGVNQI